MTSSLILGGNRFVGLFLVKQLIARGDKVTLFNRGSRNLSSEIIPHLNIITGDRNIFDDFKKVESAAADIVFDMCCYEPQQAYMAIEQFRGRIKRYIYVSTVAAYQTPLTFPITENASLGKWPLWGPYGFRKAETDEVFIKAYRDTGFPVTILRPTYILGPGNHVERELFFVNRLLSNFPIVIPGDGQSLLHFVFADEVAQSLTALSDNSEAVGQAYNVATDNAVTIQEIIRIIAEALEVKPKIVFADPSKFDIPNEPFCPELISPFADTQMLVDNHKLKSAIGLSFEPIENKLSSTVLWYAQKHIQQPLNIRPIEQKVLSHFGLL